MPSGSLEPVEQRIWRLVRHQADPFGAQVVVERAPDLAEKQAEEILLALESRGLLLRAGDHRFRVAPERRRVEVEDETDTLTSWKSFGKVLRLALKVGDRLVDSSD